MGSFRRLKKDIFDKKIKPQCAYCEQGKPAKSEGKILCPRCGIVDESFSCKKFVYSPYLRVPKREKPRSQAVDNSPSGTPKKFKE